MWNLIILLNNIGIFDRLFNEHTLCSFSVVQRVFLLQSTESQQYKSKHYSVCLVDFPFLESFKHSLFTDQTERKSSMDDRFYARCFRRDQKFTQIPWKLSCV